MQFEQDSPYSSPWTLKQRIYMLFWELSWTVFCRWTPKPFNGWRLFWLRRFGCKISGTPFVHQRARIAIPWNLVLHDRACLGDRAHAYSLALIEIREHATIAQETYLCTGTHDFAKKSLDLVTSGIIIGEHAFIGARAFVMPGVEIGANTVVGACSVVTKSVPPNSVVYGNPAKIAPSRFYRNTTNDKNSLLSDAL